MHTGLVDVFGYVANAESVGGTTPDGSLYIRVVDENVAQIVRDYSRMHKLWQEGVIDQGLLKLWLDQQLGGAGKSNSDNTDLHGQE